MSPYRFEELMGSLFENIGYKVEYTKKSRDGGKDFILYVNGKKYAIVEVKRWKDKVGIELIRQLRGVQFEDDIKQAVLITSSQFTKEAIYSASKDISKHQINLIDADTILQFIGAKKDNNSLVELEREGELFAKKKGNIINSANELLKVHYKTKSFKRAFYVQTDYSFFDNGRIRLDEEVIIFSNKKDKYEIANKIKARIISIIEDRRKYYGVFLKKVIDFFEDINNIEIICDSNYEGDIYLNEKIHIHMWMHRDNVYRVLLIDHTYCSEWTKQINKFYLPTSEIKYLP